MSARDIGRRLLVAAATAAALAASGIAAPAAQAATDAGVTLEFTDTALVSSRSSLFSVRHVVPGDHEVRSLTLKNSTGHDAIVEAAITDVRVIRDAGVVGDSFLDDLRIDWQDGSASASDLAAASPTLLSTRIPAGAAATTTMGYSFPTTATSGNTARVGGSQGIDFTVSVTLRQDPGGTTSPPSGGHEGMAPGGQLGATGSLLSPLIGLVALFLLITGVILLLARRRRRDDAGLNTDHGSSPARVEPSS